MQVEDICLHDLTKMSYRELRGIVDVDIVHYRFLENLDELVPLNTIRRRNASKYILPTGGKTVVKITHDGQEYVGQADCSFADNYAKKVGVSIALGRALKTLKSRLDA